MKGMILSVMDSEWLKTQFRLHPERTKAELAQALGIGAPGISKILAGTRQIKAHEYVAMRRFFGLPTDGERAVSAGGARAGGHYVLSPLAPALHDRERGDGDDAEDPAEAWMMPAGLLKSRTRAAPDKIRIFPVQETAMMPDLSPGEQVLVDLSDTRPSPPGLFVVSDGMGHIIRSCAHVPHSSPPAVRLSASDPKYEAYTLPLDRAGIIGRIIARLEWL